MQLKTTLAFAAATWLCGDIANAAQLPFTVVAVRYQVTEQALERVEAIVTSPVERALLTLPRVSEITSTSGHGLADFTVQFEGGATDEDLAAVNRRIEELVLAREVVVTSRTALLKSQRSK